uniref:Flavin-containing monooxygenase n=1 Tax=Bos indicus x Bos taurus TaxID=30522 RepID=A0A4W2GNQ5_BOBOX
MPGKRIMVVGAGVSGLGAIKICLEEGLEPICFEESNDIGGLWRYEEKAERGRPSVYKSVISNTSKEMMAYSDYPFPDHFPNYLHNSKIMEYLHMYVKHFHLLKHIRFLSKVCSVRKHSDFSFTGQWDVVVGLFTNPFMPLQKFPGIMRFKGQYIHSWEYKSPEKFQGKKIIVIGIGNSAIDLAIELSHVAAQVFLSTRSGAWIWNWVWDSGMPMDTVLFTRFNSLVKKIFPEFLINRWAENKLNVHFNHDIYGLLPQHRFLSHQASFGDDLPNYIITGRVRMKPNVTKFTETSAIFEDGTEEDVDVIIFATGYTCSFPFLENNSTVLDIQRSMYKFVFPPELEKPTLAFIGILQPVGATIPTSELQSQWAARITTQIMYLNSPRDACRVQYVDYMDEIASEIAVKPNLFSLFLWDPKLALELFLGPCTSYQYRLQGPGKWAGPREAILTQRERIIKPLRTRTLICAQAPCCVPLWLKSISVALLLFVLTFIIIKG